MAAILVALCALALPAAATARERPLVYAVVIDGLDGDNIARGDAPFIRSLISGEDSSAQFYRESRSVMVAETNPNHIAMMTGAYTSNSGIAGNSFALYSDLEGEEDNEADTCVPTGKEDLRQLPTETSGEHPSCLQAETVFRAIRHQGNPDNLTTAGIFGKAKLGRLFSGKNSNGRRFVDHLFAPCTPNDGPEEEEYCSDVPIEPVTQDRVLSDSVVMDEVLRTIREGVGPERERPDFTLVNLPTVDNSGHAFGGGTVPYRAAVRLADMEVERLVDELRARGDWQRSVLVVLSDHAHDETPRAVTLTSELEDAGISTDDFLIIDNGNVDMIYLADRLSPDRFELLSRMRAVIEGVNGVDQALYRERNPVDGGRANTLDGRQPDWNAAGPRTGDLYVTADPGFRFSDPSPTSNPLPGNHGGWHTRDNAFLIAGGGDYVVNGIRTGTVGDRFSDTLQNPDQAENVDLASTVLGLFGLLPTKSNAGRYLEEAIDETLLPGRGRSSIRPVVKAKRVRSGPQRTSFRVKYGPVQRRVRPPWTGGTWTLQLRRPGKDWRTVVRDEARQVKLLRLKPEKRYELRVRARVANGSLTRWGRGEIKPRG